MVAHSLLRAKQSTHSVSHLKPNGRPGSTLQSQGGIHPRLRLLHHTTSRPSGRPPRAAKNVAFSSPSPERSSMPAAAHGNDQTRGGVGYRDILFTRRIWLRQMVHLPSQTVAARHYRWLLLDNLLLPLPRGFFPPRSRVDERRCCFHCPHRVERRWGRFRDRGHSRCSLSPHTTVRARFAGGGYCDRP